ncbi:MAG: ABC transporter ATP-binding protein/permease [Thermoanaerobaculia bacterium]|nr:ABC transporter ATP-binding protein/permease [Thermoanaerobaculia bacterium]
MLTAAGTALFLYVGAVYVKAGHITIGELIIVMAYLAKIFGPLEAISDSINGIQSSVASAERVFSLLDKDPDVPEKPNAVPVSRVKGEVRFEQVNFSYHDGMTALRDISFEVKPGQRVGILGTTGAGKSTLINLLTRMHDPQSGRILLDNRDIRDYKLGDYRNLFGVVLQEPILFSTSIAENIAYGRPGATKEQIIAAAKAANAHDFIMSCQDGYDTLVGERGMQVSGGERQRISLARAFIKNAPFLILDEPTSAVDIGTEAAIMEAIGRLMEGRTTFLITHRLDTLSKCDLLLHLEKGRLQEVTSGNQPDLLENKIKRFKKQLA